MEDASPLGETDQRAGRVLKGRAATSVESLAALVGAHPDALEEIYAKAEPARPEWLGERPHGRILTLPSLRSVHLLFRPVVELVSTSFMPWQGIVFDHGGNAGKNLVFGRETMRFRVEQGPSLFDGAPTLAFSYDKNPWPTRLLRDEVRMVSHQFAIGPTFVEINGTPTLVAWFGLDAVR